MALPTNVGDQQPTEAASVRRQTFSTVCLGTSGPGGNPAENRFELPAALLVWGVTAAGPRATIRMNG